MKEYVCHKRVRAAQIVGLSISGTNDYLFKGMMTGTADLSDGTKLRLTPQMTVRNFPAVGDYLIVYEDGYRSIIPRNAFEEGYHESGEMPPLVGGPNGFSFGQALTLLKTGKRMARSGWNGKGMFVFLVPGIYPDGTTSNYHAHIDMKTADGQVVPWLASQTDVLAEDWQVVE